MNGRRLAGVAAIGAVLGGMATALAQRSYSALPPDPAVLAGKVLESKVSLIDAIKAAEAKTKGKAAIAVMRLIDGKLGIMVGVVGKGMRKEVSVDPATGKVISEKDLPTERFPGSKASGKPTKTASGLMYFDIKLGTGKRPTAKSSITVKYTGWLTNGRKFESTDDVKEPLTIPMTHVIKGWAEGIGAMKVGGKRKLIVPPDLAYGTQGRRDPRRPIPPNATLIFDVELLEVIE